VGTRFGRLESLVVIWISKSPNQNFGFDSWNQIRKQNQVFGFLRTRIETRTRVISFLKEKQSNLFIEKTLKPRAY
jgi:hypothetical protein